MLFILAFIYLLLFIYLFLLLFLKTRKRFLQVNLKNSK